MSAPHPFRPQPPPLPAAVWVTLFRHNACRPDRIPWAQARTLTPDERRAVVPSLVEFQLGESSDGHDLIRAADRHALATGDGAYAAAIRLFVQEEQRHAAYLGRFLTAEGAALRRRTWADSVFRRLRRAAGLEVAICVLLTAELIAQVYYVALRRATASPVLRGICRRMTADEAMHVRFQSERLALLRRRRPAWACRCAVSLQRLLYAAALAVVWCNHRSALRRGGLRWRAFRRAAWTAFDRAAVLMDPAAYAWSGGLGTAA
jgi:hypothetical protein